MIFNNINKVIKKREQFIKNFKVQLNENKNALPTKFHKTTKNIKTDSWFNINYNNKYKSIPTTNIDDKIYKCKFPKKIMKSKRVIMDLTTLQKDIINNWMAVYTKMYNGTLEFLQNKFPIFKNTITRKQMIEQRNHYQFTDYKNVRPNMITYRNKLIKESQLTHIKENTKISAHNINYAIIQLCNNIKVCHTNIIRGNMKTFRMKYLKHTRPSQTIDIELSAIRNNKICYSTLGNIKYIYNGKDYVLPEINYGVKINYNKIKNEYSLLIPETETPKAVGHTKNKIVVLDPGLRTFMTGLSEFECLKIGDNVNNKIAKKIKKINSVKNNPNVKTCRKKQCETKINRKIENTIDDLHWKTINILVNNYDNILLGDMSAKSIVMRNNSVLSPNQKVACLRTRYYIFKQRLEYKCNINKTNFKLVNEMLHIKNLFKLWKL